MIRIGIVGFDTSHAVEFTKRINHVGISEDHWVYGGRVVMGYPGGPSSFVTDEVLNQRTNMISGFGVEIVDSPDKLIGEVDAIMLEVQDGGKHLSYARPFIEAGIPLFIDKPFTCSVDDAKRIVELAAERRVPIFSSSSLRYALEIQEVKSRTELGCILGVDAYSPGTLHHKNPGLFNYGIHGVEIIYALMGTGCKSVRCIWDKRWEKVIGLWGDGRIGTLRAVREGARGYGFSAFYERGIVSTTIDTTYIYRELLKRVMEMFQTGKPPINPEETVEIMSFIEAALESSKRGGEECKLTI